MCIAIYSEKGNGIPEASVMRNCYERNRDGMGFAFNDEGKVRIIKGFADFDGFVKTLREYDEKYGFKDRGVLIHFRRRSHGEIAPGCTHPFPISERDEDLNALNITADYGVAHNGNIKLAIDDDSPYSDTQLFIKNYLSLIATNDNWFENKNNIRLIERLIGSKMAILSGNGDIIATSGFNRFTDGNYYSNYSYTDKDRKTGTLPIID